MKRFDIDSYLAEARTLDLVDLIIYTNDEVAKAKLYLKFYCDPTSERSRIEAYLCFTQSTLCFFQKGCQSAQAEASLLTRLQPVINALAQKGQLKSNLSY